MRPLVESWSKLVFVHDMGLRIVYVSFWHMPPNYTGLRIVYVSFWHVPLVPSWWIVSWPAGWAWDCVMDDSEDRRWWQAREWLQRYRRQLSAQQRDEKRQYNSDRRQLAHQHLSDSLCSLTHEQDRRRAAHHSRPHNPQCHLDYTSPFRLSTTFHVLSVRHMMCMRIPSLNVHVCM